jgi:hypothetical protein
MANKETIKVVTPQDIVLSHEKTVLKSLQEHKLNQSMFVDFPKRKKIPLLGLLGVWLVNKTGGIIATKYRYVGDTINSKSRRKK